MFSNSSYLLSGILHLLPYSALKGAMLAANW